MQAVRVHPAPASSLAYSPSNPAPSSALHLDQGLPIPKPSKPGEILVRIKATTVIRDMLTWPETYGHEYTIPGNDLSGVVVETFSQESTFKPGDEVFGMANAERPCTWAEYCIVLEDEIALKPKNLAWDAAAAMPLSAQTAYEALYDHAGIPVPELRDNLKRETYRSSDSEQKQRVLITGAAGAVGIYLVQLASISGLHTVTATSSNARNQEFLKSIGADETIEYSALLSEERGGYDVIIDTVGGDILLACWKNIKEGGKIISLDSASYDFVADHEKRGLSKEGVQALFFIVKGSNRSLKFLARLAELDALRCFVLQKYHISEVQEAYNHAQGRYSGRGKVILTVP
jgi:NADPH:quinone reductase-like Zn-dependent oxidoreductase